MPPVERVDPLPALKYSQLPLSIQAEVDAALGKKSSGKGKTRKAATGDGLPLSCSRCDFVADPPTEGRLAKHSTEFPGHVRFQWSPPVAT